MLGSSPALTKTGKSEGSKIDMLNSIYRSPEDLKKIRFMGVRDLIHTTLLPIEPTSAQTYHDFFNWICGREKNRCAKLDIRLHAVLGLPPSSALQDRNILDTALVHLEDFIRSKKVIGIGEIGIGSGSKMEFRAFKSQLALARKYHLPAIIESPKSDKIAQCSLILKELNKAKVERAIFNHADLDIIKIVLREPSQSIKVGLSVGKGSTVYKPKEALGIYKNFSYPQRIILNSGLAMDELSVYGLHETIVLFENENIRDDTIQAMCYGNYIDIFPEISQSLGLGKRIE